MAEDINLGSPFAGAADLDPINPNDFAPKSVGPPQMDLELQSYMSDMGLADPPKVDNTGDIRSMWHNAQVGQVPIADDPFKMGKVMRGDFRDFHNQNQFYERYASHSEFENLGFNPFRDNETLYNDNSNIFEELGRAAGEFTSLVGLGFNDAMGFGGLTDQENAESMERSMAIGSSSKGGVTGFTNNLFLNSGYTVGIMGELAIEEVTMALAEAAMGIGTVASGGTAAGATLPAMAATGGVMAARFYRALDKVKDAFKIGKGAMASSKLGRAVDTGRDLGRTMANLQDVSKARQYWNKTKASVGNLVNPVENTIDFFKNKDKISHLKNWQKTYKGFGEFYKDVRNVRLAWGEGALEGGMVQNQLERDLLAEFKSEHGRGPNREEGLKIQETALQAGMTTTLINAPVIMLSNKLTFDTLLGRGKFKNMFNDVITTSSGKKALFTRKTTKEAFEKLSDEFIKSRMQYIKNPRLWAAGAAKYTKANFAEGLQELAQESISAASEDYYMAKYQGDATRGGYMSSLARGMGKQASAQGLETFFSGFLMGGMVGPISNTVGTLTQAAGGNTTSLTDSAAGRLFQAAENQYVKKTQGEAAYRERVNAQEKLEADKKESFEKELKMLNEFYADPNKYLAPELENLVEQKEYARRMKLAEKNGDKQEFYDLKDSARSSHILTALKHGRLDTFIQRMEEMKGLNAEDFASLKTEQSQEEFMESVDKTIRYAKDIEKDWNNAQEQYKNPFTPYKYQYGSKKFNEESYNHNAWNKAVEQMVFNKQTFARTLERQMSIMNEAMQVAGLKNMSVSDMNVLFSEDTLEREINLLKQELDGAAQSVGLNETIALTPELKKLRKEKQTKYEKLNAFNIALKNFRSSKSAKGGAKERRALKTAYNAYIKSRAKESGEFVYVNDISKAFDGLVDYYLMEGRTEDANLAVNMMLDPKNFMAYVERQAAVNKVIHENREIEIRKSLEEFNKLKESNKMLNELFDAGMFIDPADLDALETNGTVPDTFYYAKDAEGHNEGEVVKTSADYIKAVAILKKFMKEKGIDLNNQLIMETLDPYTSRSRRKDANDKRTYEDYAKEFGFDPDKDVSKVPLTQVLQAIIDGEFSTEHEIALAEQLLAKADPKEVVTFTRKGASAGTYSSTAGPIIDARYSSDEYKEGKNGHPIEHIILHQEIIRRTNSLLKTDKEFVDDLSVLFAEAEEAWGKMDTLDKLNFTKDPRNLKGLESLESFTAEAMSNPTFQLFLAGISTKATGTKSTWQTFVDAVLGKLKAILGGHGNVLNAAIDLITAKIDQNVGSMSATAAPVQTTEVTKSVNDVTQSMPVSELRTKHAPLHDEIVELFKIENETRIENGSRPLLEGYETMTSAAISASPEFAEYWAGAFSRKDNAIAAYNSEQNKQEPVMGTEAVISDAEIDSFESTKDIAQQRVISIGNKLDNNQPLTAREKYMLKEPRVANKVEKYRVGKKNIPTAFNREMEASLIALGFGKDMVRFKGNPALAWKVINEGLTKAEREGDRVTRTTKELTQADINFRTDIATLIDSAYDLSSWQDIEKLLLTYPATYWREMDSSGVTVEDLKNWMDQKKQELAFSFTFGDIQVGEVVVLNNKYGTRVRVVAKSGSELLVERENLPTPKENETEKETKDREAKGKPFSIKKEAVQDKVKYRWNKLMTEEDVELETREPITPQEKEISNETTAIVEEVDVATANAEAITAAKKMTAAERKAKIKESKCK